MAGGDRGIDSTPSTKESRSAPATGVSLAPWEELTRALVGLEETGGRLAVEGSTGRPEFIVGSSEASLIRRKLPGQEGCVVSILRTASTANPLRVAVRDLT